MAYTIGSQKGKDIANNMKPGETYKASDGSTWTKNGDGTVSVTAKNGSYTANALTGGSASVSSSGGSRGSRGSRGSSSSSGSSGSSSSSSSSGSSSGGNNSQYSPTYDAGTDYQALINKAAAAGDYLSAARYEQQRNAKIAATGSAYAPTNNYAGWLDATDYGTIGKNQMANGASIEEVRDTYNKRYNKASSTVGMQQYANDETQRQMFDYIMAGGAQDASAPTFDYSAYQQANPKPSYTGSYDPQIEQLLQQILNREDFSYNVEDDPLYQQYRAMYNREADRSMRNTMAEAAAGAGGMNSYAITAAQQASDYYNSQLNDRVPELYQLAYEMYLGDKRSKVEDLGLLQRMDESQYNRYRDTMSDWYSDRDFAYGQYRDDMGDYQWNKNFNYNQAVNDRDFYYNVGRDNVADNRYAAEWNYGVNRDQLDDKRYDQTVAYQRATQLLSSGVMPDDALLEQAGISSQQAAAWLAGQTKSAGGSGAAGNANDTDATAGYSKQAQESAMKILETAAAGGGTISQDTYRVLASMGLTKSMIEDDYGVQVTQARLGGYASALERQIHTGNITLQTLLAEIDQGKAKGVLTEEEESWLLSVAEGL